MSLRIKYPRETQPLPDHQAYYSLNLPTASANIATDETVFDSSPSSSVSVNPPESEEQSMSELGHPLPKKMNS